MHSVQLPRDSAHMPLFEVLDPTCIGNHFLHDQQPSTEQLGEEAQETPRLLSLWSHAAGSRGLTWCQVLD